MQIQYELLNVVKANIWKLYVKLEANKEFMENLSLQRKGRSGKKSENMPALEQQKTSLFWAGK